MSGREVWQAQIREAERKSLNVVSVEMLGSNLPNSQLLMPCSDPTAVSGTYGVFFKLYLTLEF